jgi:hypothetical protein
MHWYIFTLLFFSSCPSVFDLNYLYILFLCTELCPSEQGVQIGAIFLLHSTYHDGAAECRSVARRVPLAVGNKVTDRPSLLTVTLF